MGEASSIKIGVPRPRPLGLVKSESIHFEDVESVSSTYGLPVPGKNVSWSPRTLVELGRSRTDGDIKRDVKSMRDLQETLRQAALLNIVAAANHDDKTTESLPPPTRAGGSQSVGIKGASILGHPIQTPACKLLAPTSNDAVNNISHFSHNLQSSATPGIQPVPPGTQQSAINQILSQRTRTISIPRPRTQNDQGAFMHRSLVEAKEKLAGMATYRTGLKKDAEIAGFLDPTHGPPQSDPMAEEGSEARQNDGEDSSKKELLRAVSCIRGTGIESAEHGSQEKTAKDANQNSNSDSQQMSKDEQRAHNVHQMQVVKRHISTSKKKELMKKLTDIAKCDAMEVTVPITSTDPNAAPPIIIMSQQKDYSPAIGEILDTKVNRTKSMTSLNGRGEEPRVPSNTRVQSETLDALLNHKEAKKRASLNLEEDLRIESINGYDKKTNGVDGLYRTHRDLKTANDMEAYMHPHSHPLLQEPFFTENGSRAALQNNSPDFLELRPLDGSPLIQNRVTLSERKRPSVSRRSLVHHSRDRLVSPSPVVYEASFHRPKASIGLISLVGQSVQSVSENKSNQASGKQQKQKGEDNSKGGDKSEETPKKSGCDHKVEETPKKSGEDPKFVPHRHWGSTAKPSSRSKSPILRTEIINHLQCVGLVNHRPANNNFPTRNKFKVNNVFNNSYPHRGDEGFFNDDDEDFDDTSSSGTPVAIKNSPHYRKSKLYNAFRASEENLSNLVDSSCIETETMMGKSLLNQSAAVFGSKEITPPPSRDPVCAGTKEPLYMGCSSRVSENDLRSQFHYVSEADEKEAQMGGKFKVMKAIDQDVYFDFQHRKYRKNTDSPMNTAADKPRMHFLKIKFNGEAKT